MTCDVVAFTMHADDLAVLLIQRKDDPFKGQWALPGGFVDENESLEKAAARELEEETHLTHLRMEQLGAFGDPGRDPRGHTVTVAYIAFLAHEPTVSAGDDAHAAEWKPFKHLVLGGTATHSIAPPPPGKRKALSKKKAAKPKGRRAAGASDTSNGPIHLAFDHARIIGRAYRRLVAHLDDPLRDTAFELVPPRFTLAELRRVYEVILGRKVPPAMLKRHLVDRGLVVPASTKLTKRAAAQLYRWNRR